MTDNDTIAAISTPLGDGGIGIVRISGSEAFEIVKRVTDMGNLKSHSIRYGRVLDSDGLLIDEALISVMAKPKSYTCEDVAEINCHGGIVSVRRVLERVLEAGARPAMPGEFTKRAFLNGRIDLSQAEAVMDIIGAKTELSHRTAMARVQGRLSKRISHYMGEILSMLAHIEAAIDYPEADLEPVDRNMLKEKVGQLTDGISDLLATADMGRQLREGIDTVIIGRPNVGKSSLLNAMLDEERAIVTDIPGTTRDTVSEYANILGIPLNITDTAGIRGTEDVIERIGVSRSLERAQNADLILYVADRSEQIHEEDISILDELKDKKTVVLLNKSDLPLVAEIGMLPGHIPDDCIIEVSIKYGNGLDKLYDVITRLFFEGRITHSQDDVISSVRHKYALQNAFRSLKAVSEAIDIGIPEDLLSIDLTDSYRCLGEITGETLDDDIIDRIFSEFCLGK